MIKLLRTKFVSLKRKNVRFHNCRENQMSRDSTRTKKTAEKIGCQGAIQADEEAPGWVHFEPLTQTVQFSLQEYFIHFSLTGCLYILLSLSLALPFFLFPFPITCPMIVRKSRTLVSLGMLLMRKRYYSKVSRYLSGATRRNNNKNTFLYPFSCSICAALSSPVYKRRSFS